MPKYSDTFASPSGYTDLVEAVRADADLPADEWALLRRWATPYQRRVARLITNPSAAPHGEANTYNNWGCRCAPCCDAYGRERRTGRAAKDFADGPGSDEQADTTPAQIKVLQGEVAAGRPLTPKGQAILNDWEAQQVL